VLVLGGATDDRRWLAAVGARADAPDADGARGDDPGPRQVPDAIAAQAGGELWATALDTRATMEQLLGTIATDGAGSAIASNPVFHSLADSVGGAEFAVLEQWRALHDSGRWELVIAAAPPMERPAELLDAPERFTDFFDNAVYRAVTSSRGPLARLTDAAASVFTWAVRNLAGPRAVDDALTFLRTLSDLEPGLRQRADRIGELLRAAGSVHLVVTPPDTAALDGAADLLGALDERRLAIGPAVVDGVHAAPPPYSADDRERLARVATGPLAAQLRWYEELAAQAARERAGVDRLLDLTASVVEIRRSDLGGADVGSTAELADLANRSIVRSRGRPSSDPSEAERAAAPSQ
jgi:hypothetical protein